MGRTDVGASTTSKQPSASQRAICLIVRAEARAGADEDVEALLRDHAHRVLAEEPGCETYVVTRLIGSREHFAAHARFIDWPAFARHGETTHLQRIMPKLTALLATPISMEIFYEV
ncbi:MAG: putative quinol monooxygenase [Hyphomonadaceae bacterium]